MKHCLLFICTASHRKTTIFNYNFEMVYDFYHLCTNFHSLGMESSWILSSYCSFLCTKATEWDNILGDNTYNIILISWRIHYQQDTDWKNRNECVSFPIFHMSYLKITIQIGWKILGHSSYGRTMSEIVSWKHTIETRDLVVFSYSIMLWFIYTNGLPSQSITVITKT